MSAPSYESILRDALERSDRGEEPTRETLLAAHPGHESTVERAWSAFESYRRFRSAFAAPSARDSRALEPGERLGDFEVVEPLARGGMGVVYRARQLSLGGREVALKVLPVESRDSLSVARFRREALAVAGLHHPHLAEVHGFGDEHGVCYFAMRLVEGPTLAHVLERSASDPAALADPPRRRAVVERTREIADALAAVHAAGLVHRDVKPSNVVLSGAADDARALLDGSAVLVDFGLVRRGNAGALTLTGGSPATPSYAAPEQLLGRDVGPLSDVFALGVTLHDLLACRTPSERMQASAGLEPIEALVPDVDPDLAAVVARAVDPDARWRYRDAAELAGDLRAWLEGRPVSARHLGAFERASRWIRRRPLRALQALAASVAAVGGLALVSAIGRYSEHAATSRAAAARGDVQSALAALARVPAWLGWPLLRDAELVDLARRAREREASDPLVAIAARLDERDARGALLAAATHARLHGLADEPLVARFLIASLRALPERDAAPAEPFAALAVARLFYERPEEGAEDRAANGELRALLSEVLVSPRLQRLDRLYLLTALSGCGRPDDVVPLLDWARAQALYSEEQRLAIAAAERIVNRAHEAGEGERVDRADAWAKVEPLAFELAAIGPESRVFYGWPVAVRGLVEALALLRDPASGPGVEPMFRALVERVDTSDAERLSRWWPVLASLRDPRVAPMLANGTESLRTVTEAASWGRACTLYGDADVLASARAAVAAAGYGPLVTLFESGVEEGELARRGARPSMRPDAETQLGADVPDSAFPPLATARAEVEGVEAAWILGDDVVHLHGLARGIEHRFARLEREIAERDFVWMGVFGRSELVLTFDLPPDAGWVDRELVLRCQIGARAYYPFHGTAALDVALNGVPLASDVCMQSAGRTEYRIEMPGQQVATGANTLSLRLDESTTTTLRFHGATIAPRRP